MQRNASPRAVVAPPVGADSLWTENAMLDADVGYLEAAVRRAAKRRGWVMNKSRSRLGYGGYVRSDGRHDRVRYQVSDDRNMVRDMGGEAELPHMLARLLRD
jgi:hypothetical protein